MEVWAGTAGNVLVAVVEVDSSELVVEEAELVTELERLEEELGRLEEDGTLLEDDTERLDEEEEEELVDTTVVFLVFDGTIILEEVELELGLKDELELLNVLVLTTRLEEVEVEDDFAAVLVFGGTTILEELEVELTTALDVELTTALEVELTTALEVGDFVLVELDTAELLVFAELEEEEDVTEVHTVLVKVVVLVWHDREKQFSFHQ